MCYVILMFTRDVGAIETQSERLASRRNRDVQMFTSIRVTQAQLGPPLSAPRWRLPQLRQGSDDLLQFGRYS